MAETASQRQLRNLQSALKAAETKYKRASWHVSNLRRYIKQAKDDQKRKSELESQLPSAIQAQCAAKAMVLKAERFVQGAKRVVSEEENANRRAAQLAKRPLRAS